MCLRSGRDLETAEAGCFRVSRPIAAGLNLRGNRPAPPGPDPLRRTAEGEKHLKDCDVSGEHAESD